MISYHAIFWFGRLGEEEAPAIGWFSLSCEPKIRTGAFLIAGKEIHRLYHSKRLAVGQGPSGSFGVRAVKDQTKVKKKALNVSVA